MFYVIGRVEPGSEHSPILYNTVQYKLIALSLTASCSCTASSGQCVMTAISYGAPELWSSCSVNQLQRALGRTSNNLGRCLGNEPTFSVGSPVCGNGIREGDEICDCGSEQVSIQLQN